jgi:hypothetical protein
MGLSVFDLSSSKVANSQSESQKGYTCPCSYSDYYFVEFPCEQVAFFSWQRDGSEANFACLDCLSAAFNEYRSCHSFISDSLSLINFLLKRCDSVISTIFVDFYI